MMQQAITFACVMTAEGFQLNICSGDDLVPDSTKPLSDLKFIYYQWSHAIFKSEFIGKAQEIDY